MTDETIAAATDCLEVRLCAAMLLHGLFQLKTLAVHGCVKLTDEALSTIGSVLGCACIPCCATSCCNCRRAQRCRDSLEELELLRCSQLTDDGLAQLGDLTNLLVLNVAGLTNVSADATRRLSARLPALNVVF